MKGYDMTSYKLIMKDLTEMDLVALKGYANELEAFRSRVNRYCNELEAGIDSCSHFMLDSGSKKAFQKGYRVAADIKACLFPVEKLLEKVYQTIRGTELSRDLEH